jgi:hypothetical protein
MRSDDNLGDIILCYLDEGPCDEEQLARSTRRNARSVYRALRILEGEGRAHISGYRRSAHLPGSVALWQKGFGLRTILELQTHRNRPIALPRS